VLVPILKTAGIGPSRFVDLLDTIDAAGETSLQVRKGSTLGGPYKARQ
jgi:hypothetical protein